MGREVALKRVGGNGFGGKPLWKGGEWKDKQPSAREEERFAPTYLLLFHCLFHCALWDIICVWIFCLHVCLCNITGHRTSWIPL